MAYNKDDDYQSLIDEAVKNGDYAKASQYEQSRNEKIDAEGLSYEKTYNYVKPNGVNDNTYNQMNSQFSTSDDVKNAEQKKTQGLSNLEGLTNKDQIVSDDVWSGINSQFNVPSTVREADIYLSSQLAKIQSGRTSYTNQVKEMMDKIANREKFSYDVDTDPLFQQALASAMNSGKQAMQDTIGQASALTGGYGSTYATSAANQSYNAFIEDAYDNLPQYYQMAMDAYQMEGEELYNQLAMYNEADDKEYNRNVTAYEATYQHRNRMYDEAYNQYRDTKNDAFAKGNLQLSEHGQLVSDAYNYYNAASDYADTMYNREYNSWLDSVNIAYQNAQMQNTDWWNQTNFDEGVRQYNQNYAQAEDHFTRNQEFQATESQKQRDWQSAEAEKERAFTASENAKNRSVKGSGGGGGGDLKSPTQTQKQKALEAYNNGGEAEYFKYLDSLPSDVDVAEIDMYVNGDGSESNKGYGTLPYSQRTYTVIDDGGNNWGWGIDNNAKVKDQYGNVYTLKQLAEYDEDIAKELSKKIYTVGKTYTKK